MNNESVWYIIKALASLFNSSQERLAFLEAEIGQMGLNQRAELQRDFATIGSGLQRLAKQIGELQ